MFKLIEDEMKSIIDDPDEAAQASFEGVAMLRKMADGMSTKAEEILQTRVVAVKEVVRDWQQWIPALKSEVKSLFEDKQALRKLGPDELRSLKETAKEPDAAAPKLGKKKARWVICGNYETEKPEQETYSGGADSAALHLMVKKASVEG